MRVVDKGPGNSDPLLLTAGKLHGPVVKTITQADQIRQSKTALARLVIQSQPGSHLATVRTFFEAGGIAADRLEFARRVPLPDYLRLFQNLDLGLDPFPYNGHTSTLDSLWMGVPVVTLAGRTAVARGGVSILSNVGLPEFIARSEQDYVDIALASAASSASACSTQWSRSGPRS